MQNKIDIEDGYFSVTVDVAPGKRLSAFVAAIDGLEVFLLQERRLQSAQYFPFNAAPTL